MLSAYDISISGLIAQRQRLNAISSNIANISTLENEAGEAKPYQPRYVVFQADEDSEYPTGTAGVKIAEYGIEDIEPIYKHDPNHPLAIKEGPWTGYVAHPNINLQTQFVNAMEATRAYEANIGVIEATRELSQQTLRILA